MQGAIGALVMVLLSRREAPGARWTPPSLYCNGQHWGFHTVQYSLKLDDGNDHSSCQTGSHLWPRREKHQLKDLRGNRIIFLVV